MGRDAKYFLASHALRTCEARALRTPRITLTALRAFRKNQKTTVLQSKHGSDIKVHFADRSEQGFYSKAM